PVEGQRDCGGDSHAVLSEVCEMGKRVLRVVIATDALEGAPDGRQGRQKAQDAGMAGTTLRSVVPRAGVEAEEQLDVLRCGSGVDASQRWARERGYVPPSRTIANSICRRGKSPETRRGRRRPVKDAPGLSVSANRGQLVDP